MAAKASVGLARAAEGVPQRCAVAGQPEWGSMASSRGEAHGLALASPGLANMQSKYVNSVACVNLHVST